jgi:DNA-binding response OmpR family regulator
LLERWLGEAGYAVVTGSPNAPVQQDPARLVIANVSKPRYAGALIRSLEAAYAAPVLAISARFRHGLGASADAARQFGARKVLPKPFTRAELLAAVRESIEDP